MTFTEEDLVNYVSKAIVPKEAMIQLNQLLFKELREYCITCEDDRMICVLSPQCPKRVLLKVRIQSGAEIGDLPKFCYSQALNNIRRYLNKKTTLYTPQDELVFNDDFIEIMFPRLQKKILSLYQKDMAEIHKIIEKSKVSAVHLDLQHADYDIFQKIKNNDKLIREGTFIYDFIGEFLIIWYDQTISISNFKNNISIVNAKNDIIEDLKVVDLVFHTYCSELAITGITTLFGENQINLSMKIPFSQIIAERKDPEGQYFYDLITFLQNYFYEIEISIDSQNYIDISLKYQNTEHFLKRIKLMPLTYRTIFQIVQKMDQLRKIDQIEVPK